MIDYYDILELSDNCSEKEIKKQYHGLSKIYHPDKNNGNDNQFLKIKEAYDTLSNNERRKKYNIQRIFKNIDFSEEEYELFFRYYRNLVNSKEFRLMNTLYNTIPEKVKQDIKEKFNKKVYDLKKKELVKKEKSIDINELNNDETIVLYVSYQDYFNNILKIIHIYTKNGIYYLYLRDYKNKTILLNNMDCFLTLKIYVKDDFL